MPVYRLYYIFIMKSGCHSEILTEISYLLLVMHVNHAQTAKIFPKCIWASSLSKILSPSANLDKKLKGGTLEFTICFFLHMRRATSKKSWSYQHSLENGGWSRTTIGQPSNQRILVPQTQSLPQEGPPLWNIIFGIQNISVKLLGEKRRKQMIWFGDFLEESRVSNPCKACLEFTL